MSGRALVPMAVAHQAKTSLNSGSLVRDSGAFAAGQAERTLFGAATPYKGPLSLNFAAVSAGPRLTIYCGCSLTYTATIERAGAIVDSLSVTGSPNDDEAGVLPPQASDEFPLQNGDVFHLALEGEAIYSGQITFPTINPPVCGGTTFTGTADVAGTTGLQAYGTNDALGVVTTSGNTYTASSLPPITPSWGVAIVAYTREDSLDYAETASLDIVTDIQASTFCGASQDTDGDGIPDSSDQCPTVAGPAPTGCPAPPQGGPVAECDRYWVKPGATLTVPVSGVLANDSDPSGLPLSAVVDHISFGISTHPYLLSSDGALRFSSPASQKPSKATIEYHVVNTAGVASARTTILIYVQTQVPSPAALKPCAPASFSSQPKYWYVALGDSFSAGEGACDPETNAPAHCDYEKGSDTSSDQCHRSRNSYPYLLKEDLYNWNFKFLACSGAVVHDMFYTNRDNKSEKPQLDELRKLNEATNGGVRLITLTLGGNDMQFVPLLTECFIAHHIHHQKCFTLGNPPVSFPQREKSGPCRDPGSLTEFALIRYRLECVYKFIHEAAPNAAIFVLGYPHLFGEPSFSDECDLDTVDAEEIRQLEDTFNEEINAAVTAANQALHHNYLAFVNEAHAFDHRELCTKHKPSHVKGLWLPPPRYLNHYLSHFTGASEGRPESFHPNSLGQSYMYGMLFSRAIIAAGL
jgi:lysophospholipase L1-like esterase